MSYTPMHYRKLPVAEHGAFGQLPFLVRGTAAMLLKYCDDQGVFALGGKTPIEAVARKCAAEPSERRAIAQHIEKLLAVGYIRRATDSLVVAEQEAEWVRLTSTRSSRSLTEPSRAAGSTPAGRHQDHRRTIGAPSAHVSETAAAPSADCCGTVDARSENNLTTRNHSGDMLALDQIRSDQIRGDDTREEADDQSACLDTDLKINHQPNASDVAMPEQHAPTSAAECDPWGLLPDVRPSSASDGSALDDVAAISETATKTTAKKKPSRPKPPTLSVDDLNEQERRVHDAIVGDETLSRVCTTVPRLARNLIKIVTDKAAAGIRIDPMAELRKASNWNTTPGKKWWLPTGGNAGLTNWFENAEGTPTSAQQGLFTPSLITPSTKAPYNGPKVIPPIYRLDPAEEERRIANKKISARMFHDTGVD